MRRAILLTLLLLGAAPARADSAGAGGHPAAIPGAGATRAERSFETFAAEWMQQARANEARGRQQPRVQPGATSPVFTYRGYGDDYRIELRPTGHSSAPWVGLLMYTEHVYSCENARGQACRVSSSFPVTEIFRYRDGRWSY